MTTCILSAGTTLAAHRAFGAVAAAMPTAEIEIRRQPQGRTGVILLDEPDADVRRRAQRIASDALARAEPELDQ